MPDKIHYNYGYWPFKTPQWLFKTIAICRIVFHIIRLGSAVILRSFFQKITFQQFKSYGDQFANSVLKATYCDLTVFGREHIPLQHSYLLMSNHPSIFDIPVLFKAIDRDLRMVAKQELFRIPIFGHAMAIAEFVPVARSHRETAIKQLLKSKEILAKNCLVWVAPEGTRTNAPNLINPLKKGCFYLAIELQVDIVPIWIEASEKVIPARQIQIFPNQKVSVHIGKPISVQGMTIKDLHVLMEHTRQAIIDLKPKS